MATHYGGMLIDLRECAPFASTAIDRKRPELAFPAQAFEGAFNCLQGHCLDGPP